MHLSRSRGSFARGLAALMAVAVALRSGSIGASPGDIYSMPAPGVSAETPKSKDIKTGDVSVSTQTGAMTWSYPITVPPGRKSPSLALSYSSQAPIYGGIAAGWSLEGIPEIRYDTSRSILAFKYGGREESQGASVAPFDDRFVSSLAGGRPLVAVNEGSLLPSGVLQTLRAQNDTSFLRYQRMETTQSFRWRVLSPDGTTYLFGEASRISGCANIGDGNAPLTSMSDSFGNEVSYHWVAGVDGECRIDEIRYGQNVNASVSHFATVKFGYVTAPTCGGIPVGSQADHRAGFKRVTGGGRLETITATAYPPGAPGSPVHSRVVTLAYDATAQLCDREHAPVRLLTSIDEKAWGTDAPLVDLPAITFEYGTPKLTFTNQAPKDSAPWTFLSSDQHLAWGYRFEDSRWPTIEGMFVDLDGDQLVDRLTNIPSATTDGECKARWQRNTGSGFEASTGIITLPRLKWHNDPPGTPNGSATAAVEPTLNREGCALNGQVTDYTNMVDTTPTNQGTYLAYRWIDMDGDNLTDLVAAIHAYPKKYDPVQGDAFPFTPEPTLFGAWPPCSGPQPDKCKALTTSCMDPARSSPNSPNSLDWSGVNSCLASASDQGCYRQTANEGSAFYAGPVNPPPTNTSVDGFRMPYEACGGLYPWFIYRNRGNGSFDTSPVIKYQPAPLESDTGDSGLHGPGIASTHHAVIDFDGDSILDVIVRERNGWWWYVWLGDGTGGVHPERYVFEVRSAQNYVNGVGTIPSTTGNSTVGLIDLTGDGLLEHWVAKQDANDNFHANVAINAGLFFRLVSTTDGEYDTVSAPTFAVKPGDDAVSEVTVASPFPNRPPREGKRRATNRLMDIDHDGRVDVVRPNTSGANVAHYNFGGQFDASKSIAGNTFPANRETMTIAPQEGSGIPGRWYLLQDFADLDGDGIAEGYYWANNQLLTVKHDAAVNGPPRLLTKIKNGRGAETAIAYDSMHSATVTQSPTERWTDAYAKHSWESDPSIPKRTKTTPQKRWVVKNVAVTDHLAGTVSTTSYAYFNPRHGRDDEDRFGFRGFERVVATSPSGSKSTSLYDYAVDWSGRLVKTVMQAAGAGPTGPVHTWTKTTWEERQLFSGAIKTYHATLSEQATCFEGQTEAACTPTSAAAYTRTTPTLTAISSIGSFGTPQLWHETGSLLQAGTSAADGDRETVGEFTLVSDALSYRLRQLTLTENHRVSGTMTMYGKTASTWDSTYRVALTSEVWFDSVDANRAITAFEYDMQTGNQTKRWKPEQHATPSGPALVSTYDSRKLFVASDIDEVGHTRSYDYNYGTGTKLTTHGPNVRDCTPGPNCLDGPLYPVLEQHGIKIDGLGREISRWETTSGDGAFLVLKQFSEMIYVDETATPTTAPTSVTQRTRITETGAWREEKTEVDGSGRVKRVTVFVQGSAPVDQVTTYEYRNDGTLKHVTVPDPTANDTSTVTYTYTFDSLGRLTSLRRPDAAAEADRSGIDVEYDGVWKTTREVVGAAGGTAAVTKTKTDDFGRLIEFHEQLNPSPATWAVTKYSYGPDDLVARVVDPEELVTTDLVHDFAGHRTAITRAGRTWRYGYDLNGNVESEISPVPSGGSEIDYTTSIVYDALDRPLSKVIGRRDLSDNDRQLFASDRETFTWDIGRNHKGRLHSWRAFGPQDSASTPQITHITNVIDGQGRVTHIEQRMAIAGYSELIRIYEQTWTFHGEKLGSHYSDFMGGPNSTLRRVEYDPRGFPANLNVGPMPNGNSQNVAVQTRNVAGLVTKRRTNLPGGAWVESNWTFDKIGRVTSQVVQKGPTIAQVARQDLTYFGNDDPKRLDHYFDSPMFKRFEYVYDSRHQLTHAKETTVEGYYEGIFEHSVAGRLTRASENSTLVPSQPGRDLVNRDVSYLYGDADKERVTRLANTAGGSTFSEYTYDPAGNQLTRCYGVAVPTCADLTEYAYDGGNQLRRTKRTVNGITTIEEYWYDKDGTRIAVVTKTAAGVKTGMKWFIGEVEAHYDGLGNITKIYSHPSLGTTVTRTERLSDTQTLAEHQFHGLANNTIAAVSTDGTINAQMSYTPFGALIEADTDLANLSAVLDAHPRRFNDKYQDAGSGLTYYGARYYDRAILAWTQADPFFDIVPDAAGMGPRRANRYVFTLNNPLSYFDPDGLDSRNWGFDQFMSEAQSGSVAAIEDPWLQGAIARAHAADPWIHNKKKKPRDCGTSPPGVCDGSVYKPMQVTYIPPVVFKEGAEARAHARDQACLKGRNTPGCPLPKVSGTMVAAMTAGLFTAGFGGFLIAAAQRASISVMFRIGVLSSAPTAAVTRAVLQRAAESGGPTTYVVTRLTQAPQLGRALSVATGPGAESLANAARSAGQLFSGHIPNQLIHQLERGGLAVTSRTLMEGVEAVEIRFHAQAMEFVMPFLK